MPSPSASRVSWARWAAAWLAYWLQVAACAGDTATGWPAARATRMRSSVAMKVMAMRLKTLPSARVVRVSDVAHRRFTGGGSDLSRRRRARFDGTPLTASRRRRFGAFAFDNERAVARRGSIAHRPLRARRWFMRRGSRLEGTVAGIRDDHVGAARAARSDGRLLR